MADFTVVNASEAELTNVNAGGIDVPALSVRDSITLTNAEAFALVQIADVAVLTDAASNKSKRKIARLLKYRKVVSL